MIYHIFANRSNIGDWLSARGIQQLLAPFEVTECLCDEPFLDETFARLAEAGEKDFIVIGGGGLFMDYFVPFWQRFKSVATRVPFGLWGVGYCDIKHEPSRPPDRLLEDIVAQSSFTFVRDELTRAYLKNSNLEPALPCPSLCVLKKLPSSGRDVLHATNYSTVGEKAYEAMRAFAQDFGKATERVYRETDHRIPAGKENDLSRILSLYTMSEYVLSSALHGCVIGVAMGKKVLAVSGDRKIDAFMAAVGLKDWVLDAAAIDQLDTLWAKRDLAPSVEGKLEAIRRRHEEIAQAIKRWMAQERRPRKVSL